MKRGLAIAALAACNGTPDGAIDGGLDGALCARPALAAPWLASDLAQTIADLSTPRATLAERDAARAYLLQRLAEWSPVLQSYAGGANVVAEVPATEPTLPRIVVGAHFDTVDGSPGANDNASGVAVVLALARYLRETSCRSSPVSLVLFDQEELGLFGSRSYARSLTEPIRAVHTIDQVAWDGDGDRRFELELPTPALEAEWRAAATVVGVTVSTTTTGGTDHTSFRDEGFAAVGLTEEYVGGDTSPHRHTAGDVASTVDTAYLALAAQLTAQVILDQLQIATSDDLP